MVFGISRIAFGPAATTITAVDANSRKSAEISKVSSAPRCTPPMPPVAKTSIPAACAAIIVAATVVAPLLPVDITKAISARDNLAISRACAKAVNCSGSNPMYS